MINNVNVTPYEVVRWRGLCFNENFLMVYYSIQYCIKQNYGRTGSQLRDDLSPTSQGEKLIN